MAHAKLGDTVRVHYTSTLEDGALFARSEPDQPLQLTIGAGEVIRGVEQAVIGMAPGDHKSALVPPEQAFGQYRSELRSEISRDRLPSDMAPSDVKTCAARGLVVR
jgi:peptidylprolyl isomerase